MKPLIEMVDNNLVDLGDDVELCLAGQVKVHQLQVLSPELRVLLINWQGGKYFLIDFLSWTEILSTNMVLNIEIPLMTSQKTSDSSMKSQKELVIRMLHLLIEEFNCNHQADLQGDERKVNAE